MSNEIKGLRFMLTNKGNYMVSSAGAAYTHGEIVIPSEYNGKPVIRIAYGAFAGCVDLRSITIPDSVTVIDQAAFSGCSSLENITIPNSVTTIGFGAFYNCKALRNITIPDSVTRIGDCAFENCKSLTNINIPDSLLREKIFNDKVLFYTVKLGLYKNNDKIKLDKQNINQLNAIESTLKTVSPKQNIIINIIALCLSIIAVVLFSIDMDDTIPFVIMSFISSVISLVFLIVNLSKRKTKFDNIEDAFLKIDYHNKLTQNEEQTQTLKEEKIEKFNPEIPQSKTVQPEKVQLKTTETKNLSIKEKLRQLKELYEEGLITESEYNEQRKKHINEL